MDADVVPGAVPPRPGWILPAAMSSAGSQLKGPSRTQLSFRSRPPARASRGPARFWPSAMPERQVPPALWIPTRLGRLAAAIGAILAVGGGAAVAGTPQALAWIAARGGQRFATTAAALAQCLDVTGPQALAGWIAQQSLLVAAGVSLVIRGMLRHRQPPGGRGFTGLALVLAGAAVAGQVPVGAVVSNALGDLTGMRPGPGGTGWWIIVSATAIVATVIPAVMALSRRGATAGWLALALAAWALAAAAVPAGISRADVVAAIAWDCGSLAILTALLVAARGVIREVRGQHAAPAAPRVKPSEAVARPAAVDRQVPDAERVDAATDVAEPTLYTDGSDDDLDDGGRGLSKAERKRLKKLARIREAEEAAAAA